MELDLTPRELLTTTRAVRKRLDLERPVEREVVEECLELAFQAPNGSDQQTWGWVLVDDPDTRAQMAAIYMAALKDSVARPRPERSGTRATPPPQTAKQQRMTESVMYLMEHL